MSAGNANERRENTASVGSRILLCGTALMLFGIALENRETSAPSSLHVNSLIARIPIVAGAVLALFGGTRMSMGVRPLARAFFGAGTFIGALVAPIVASQVNPSLKNASWTTSALLPFFVFRILGLIWVSTGLLRVFPGDKR